VVSCSFSIFLTKSRLCFAQLRFLSKYFRAFLREVLGGNATLTGLKALMDIDNLLALLDWEKTTEPSGGMSRIVMDIG
jgi:hypothetical protein